MLKEKVLIKKILFALIRLEIQVKNVIIYYVFKNKLLTGMLLKTVRDNAVEHSREWILYNIYEEENRFFRSAGNIFT